MKANKYKLKPTKEQREKIVIPFGCARFVFNDALAKKKQFWDSGAYLITRDELQFKNFRRIVMKMRPSIVTSKE